MPWLLHSLIITLWVWSLTPQASIFLEIMMVYWSELDSWRHTPIASRPSVFIIMLRDHGWLSSLIAESQKVHMRSCANVIMLAITGLDARTKSPGPFFSRKEDQDIRLSDWSCSSNISVKKKLSMPDDDFDPSQPLTVLSRDQLIESAHVVCWSFDYVESERAVSLKGFESSGGSAYKAAHVSVLAM